MIGRLGVPSDVAGWLALFIAVVIAQRIAELVLSSRHARVMLVRGAREHDAGHFPLLIVVHVLFPIALVAEVLLLGARPSPLWPLWVGIWALAQVLRYAAVRALGERWNVRILVLPDTPPVRTGPYAWLRHPNYLAVVLELFAAPMIFGAWRTAILISLLDLIALRVRIRAEERALGISHTSPWQRMPSAIRAFMDLS